MGKSYKQRYWYHLCIECNCVENDETVNISCFVKDVLAMCWLLTVWLFWNVVNRKSQANITQGLKVQADRPPFFMITKIKPFEIKEKKLFALSYRYLIFPLACPQMCKISAPLKSSFSFCRAVQSGDRGFLKNKKIVLSLKMHCTQCRQANSR